jgi:hypothetical protein
MESVQEMRTCFQLPLSLGITLTATGERCRSRIPAFNSLSRDHLLYVPSIVTLALLSTPSLGITWLKVKLE